MDSFKPEPFTEREAFLWSIEQAAFQAHEQWFNGHSIAVGRGEFVTSLREMEKAFGWSLKRVRGFMDRMGKAEKWAQRRAYEGAQSPTVISVCNYDVYQSVADDKGTVEGTAKGTRRAQSGHSKGTQQKEGNKGNKSKKEDSPSDSSTGKPIEAPMTALVLVSQPEREDEAQLAFTAYVDLRCEIVPDARPLVLHPDRRKHLTARLREVGGLAGWGNVLSSIRASPFLRGDGARGGRFVAELDWLLKPINLRKVMEGNYDERTSGAVVRSRGAPSTIDALAEARSMLGFGG